MYTVKHTRRSKVNSQESVSSPKYLTVRLGGKCLYPLNHPASLSVHTLDELLRMDSKKGNEPLKT